MHRSSVIRQSISQGTLNSGSRALPLLNLQRRFLRRDERANAVNETTSGSSSSITPIHQVSAPIGQGGQWRVIRPGGRSSVSGIVATVFGCTGFVGRYVVSSLGRIGSQCIVPYRGDGMNARHLKLAGDLGQIVPVPFDLFDKDSVNRAVAKSNVVINLVGHRYETIHWKYHDTNVKAAYRLAKIAKEAGVERFIHVSCLGASQRAESAFLRTKAEGEEVVRQIYPDAIIMRPAPIFGHEDRFLNRYADLLNFSPIFPNFGRHLDQEVQPIYVVDVAQAILNAITVPGALGKTYELGGPDVFTQRQLIELIRAEIYREERPIVPIPGFVGRLAASVIERLPRDNWKTLTRDMLDQALATLTVRPGAPSLSDLGVKPTTIASQAGAILLRHRHARGPNVQGHLTPSQSERLRSGEGNRAGFQSYAGSSGP